MPWLWGPTWLIQRHGKCVTSSYDSIHVHSYPRFVSFCTLLVSRYLTFTCVFMCLSWMSSQMTTFLQILLTLKQMEPNGYLYVILQWCNVIIQLWKSDGHTLTCPISFYFSRYFQNHHHQVYQKMITVCDSFISIMTDLIKRSSPVLTFSIITTIDNHQKMPTSANVLCGSSWQWPRPVSTRPFAIQSLSSATYIPFACLFQKMN